jgi:hypothetical protein
MGHTPSDSHRGCRSACGNGRAELRSAQLTQVGSRVQMLVNQSLPRLPASVTPPHNPCLPEKHCPGFPGVVRLPIGERVRCGRVGELRRLAWVIRPQFDHRSDWWRKLHSRTNRLQMWTRSESSRMSACGRDCSAPVRHDHATRAADTTRSHHDSWRQSGRPRPTQRGRSGALRDGRFRRQYGIRSTHTRPAAAWTADRPSPPAEAGRCAGCARARSAVPRA